MIDLAVIKQCPCGGEAHLIEADEDAEIYFDPFVRCLECERTGVSGKMPSEAVKYWNTGLTFSLPGCAPEYEELGMTLGMALDQAESGKGKRRHANAGERFGNQLICQIGRLGLDFNRGQAVKKIVESLRMERQGEIEAAKNELLGAINYIASRVILLCEAQPVSVE
jgi:hypothetical protein